MKKYYVITYGCQMNLHESEKIAGILTELGYTECKCEQDADIVMFLYRDDYYNQASERKKEADLIISKNRAGSTHEGLPFIFSGEYSRFNEKKD